MPRRPVRELRQIAYVIGVCRWPPLSEPPDVPPQAQRPPAGGHRARGHRGKSPLLPAMRVGEPTGRDPELWSRNDTAAGTGMKGRDPGVTRETPRTTPEDSMERRIFAGASRNEAHEGRTKAWVRRSVKCRKPRRGNPVRGTEGGLLLPPGPKPRWLEAHNHSSKPKLEAQVYF